MDTTKYDNIVSPAHRYGYYNNFTASYPKMQVSFDKFRPQLPELENNITTNSNWTKHNNTKDKTKFIQAFSLYSRDSN